MSLFLLDAIFRIFEIRGRVPGDESFPERPAKSWFTGNSGRLIRLLAVSAVMVAVLVLIMWAVVSLVIHSL
jgi:hypothetical protein